MTRARASHLDPEPTASVRMAPAWRRNDPALEADAIAFWRKLAILPAGVTPESRVKELCSVAYVDGQVAAVATAAIEPVPFLRARLAFFRCATSPEHRSAVLLGQITIHAFDTLGAWAVANPQTGVKGMAAVIEGALYPQMIKRPVWRFRHVHLHLAGYTDNGQQIRMGWFPNLRVETVPLRPQPIVLER